MCEVTFRGMPLQWLPSESPRRNSFRRQRRRSHSISVGKCRAMAFMGRVESHLRSGSRRGPGVWAPPEHIVSYPSPFPPACPWIMGTPPRRASRANGFSPRRNQQGENTSPGNPPLWGQTRHLPTPVPAWWKTAIKRHADPREIQTYRLNTTNAKDLAVYCWVI